MNPFDKELGQTQAVCHQGGVMQVQSNAIGFKAGQPALIADILSQMRYSVRRLTPTEAERLMGLPDFYTVPVGLQITDELVAEFQRVHDAYGAIMADYAHAKWEREGRKGREPKPPKPKSAAWVRKWLERITNPATCPDSPRYKACGNGMCTNQVRWIFTRLLSKEGVEW